MFLGLVKTFAVCDFTLLPCHSFYVAKEAKRYDYLILILLLVFATMAFDLVLPRQSSHVTRFLAFVELTRAPGWQFVHPMAFGYTA